MGRQYAKIAERNDLVRDMGSQAILNTDLTVVRKHEKRAADIAREESREQEIQSLRNELTEIRDMLKSLLGKK